MAGEAIDDDSRGRPVASARLGAASARYREHVIATRLAHDLPVLREHLRVDMAHAVMLAEQGILQPQDARAILRTLRDVHAEPDRMTARPEHDSLVLQIEHHLAQRVGADVAGRLHTGRSRIDHTPAVQRLVTRDWILRIHDAITRTSRAVSEVADRHEDTVMPGWTHLQHAQPWLLSHYLRRFLHMFDRHIERLEQAYARVNRSSLGGAALGGTSWPLDRQRVARLLGHDRVVDHAMDAGSHSLDWISETVAVLSIALVDLGRLASDLYVWHSSEFAYVELGDDYCGTSSIMPQKKNPIALEYVRGNAGRSLGWLPTVLGVSRAATSTDVDHAFVGTGVNEACELTWRSFDLMDGVIGSLWIDEVRLARAARAGWSTATGLADGLVRRTGLPFRTCHQVVGALVRDAVESGTDPEDITGADLDRAARVVMGSSLGLTTDWIRRALDIGEFVTGRSTRGGTSPGEMARLREDSLARLVARERWGTARHERCAAAQEELDDAVDALIGTDAQPPRH